MYVRPRYIDDRDQAENSSTGVSIVHDQLSALLGIVLARNGNRNLVVGNSRLSLCMLMRHEQETKVVNHKEGCTTDSGLTPPC